MLFRACVYFLVNNLTGQDGITFSAHDLVPAAVFFHEQLRAFLGVFHILNVHFHRVFRAFFEVAAFFRRTVLQQLDRKTNRHAEIDSEVGLREAKNPIFHTLKPF
ncbi:MAG: hypothetical protein UY74_C0040G0007 [Candidatus Kaiserbacteria bacterium GW2011_GWC2_52_8b]|uniref:Uncharacterized protein n=1 Tax=Candidatus Kaiserbacteria bacterium GW2011_GWC2_52_8b TaxID=1618676 RepID=A0A0G1XHP6_9BACT|nr:MAG: hypothetical protein UY74_C0040G0007 [Candidatus Kaiserbacteria bacterium GW2011_GWC2_52_8b]